MTTETVVSHSGVARPSRAEVEQALCIALLPKVSRTFALSIEALPGRLRRAVRVAYLLCRIVDTVEDEHGIDGVARVHLFDELDALLHNDLRDPLRFEEACAHHQLGGNDAEVELCLSAGAVFHEFRRLPCGQQRAVRPCLATMSAGMRDYAARGDAAGKLRMADMGDLERYCYFVAGTVGQLLTSLFGQSVPELGPHAKEAVLSRAVPFGIGLQLVNIVKDIAADERRNSCYLPLSVAERHRVSLDELFDPQQREPALAVVAEVCGRARHHLLKAAQYTIAWPPAHGCHVRLFCAVPLALAFATLVEVESGNGTLQRGTEPKVSRELLATLLDEVPEACGDDARLLALLERYGGPPASEVSGAPTGGLS